MACILVADDDDVVRGLLKKLLVRQGHQVLEAANGNVSIKLCQQEAVDLVITDVIMPERDGIELIQAVRKQFPAVKIICISGGGRIDKNIYLDTARKFGAHCTMSKPFLIEEMVAAVNEALAI